MFSTTSHLVNYFQICLTHSLLVGMEPHRTVKPQARLLFSSCVSIAPMAANKDLTPPRVFFFLAAAPGLNCHTHPPPLPLPGRPILRNMMQLSDGPSLPALLMLSC